MLFTNYSSTVWKTFIVWLGVSSFCCAAEALTVFTAKWCPNCLVFKQDLDENPELWKDYKVEFVDFDQNKDMARELGVKRLPTFILHDHNGDEVGRKVGYHKASGLLRWLKETK